MDVDAHNIDSDDYDSVDLEDDTDTDTDCETISLQPVSDCKSDFCCKKYCLLKFDDDFRSRLKSDLSSLKENEKKIYLFALISKKIVKYKKVLKESVQFDYTVKEYGIPRSVCSNAFIILHDTTIRMVRTLYQKMSKNDLIPIDKRGKNNKHRIISQHTRELIKSHFYDIFKSPNIFKSSKKNQKQSKIYQLWRDFKQKYPNENVPLLSYSKYIHLDITSEDLKEFMCAKKARNILTERQSN